jgi:CDGSH-type Zn-finger protein
MSVRSETGTGRDREEFAGIGEPTVVACPDGPLLVRGDVRLVDADGNTIPRHRRTLALCRCGASNVKPFCDGTHKLTRFRTEPDPADESRQAP